MTPNGRCAVLHPAVAEAARRTGADAVGLVALGPTALLDLTLDQVVLRWGPGRTAGDPSSPVQHAARVVGDRSVPLLALPRVVAKVALLGARGDGGADDDPAPEDRSPDGHLAAQRALAAADPARVLRGDVVDLLPEALALVPDDVLPVVTTTWALSALDRDRRLRFLQHLDAAATDRAVAWVSVEGVGVAPSVPTMGDRPASGHSVIGLVLLEHRTLRAEALGRCWSRGAVMSWLAG